MSINQLLLHDRQKYNPIIKYIKNVKFSYINDTKGDFILNETCILYLSILFHIQHHDYIEIRMKELGNNYKLRILLVNIDDEMNSSKALIELNRLCFLYDITLILGFSDIECARYIECLKQYENNKSTNIIQERIETEYLPRLTKTLTNIKSINKTDVTTLLDTFNNFANICQASEQQLLVCPGIGEKKVKRLYQVMNEPFNKKKKINFFTSSSDSMVDNNISSNKIDVINKDSNKEIINIDENESTL